MTHDVLTGPEVCEVLRTKSIAGALSRGLR